MQDEEEKKVVDGEEVATDADVTEKSADVEE